MSTTTRAALYIRVSTEEQALHGFSLAEQQHDLEEYARKHHYAIVGLYADEGTTARKALSHRRELHRLLDDVRAGEVDIIVLKCLDRWSRNVADFYKIQSILDEHNVQWVCTQEDYNTTTTNGRLMLNLKLSIAQNESDQTADRIKYVQQGMIRRGEEVGGRPPFAYKLVNRKLQIVKEQVPAAEFIFQSFLDGHAPARIAHDVFAQFGFALTSKRVRLTLRNPTYKGRRYNIDNFCPAIISAATFDAVQEKLSHNKPWPKNRDFLYLFRGKLICPGCGNILFGHNVQRTNDRGYKYLSIHYWCGKHYVSGAPDAEAGGCPYGSAVSERVIEKFLLNHLPDLLETYQIETQQRQHRSRLEPKERIASINKKLDRLKDLYVDSFISKDAYVSDYTKLQQELSSALRDQAAEHVTPPAVGKLMDTDIDDFRQIYAGMDRQHRYDLWQSTIKSIRIDTKIDASALKRQRTYSFKVEFY